MTTANSFRVEKCEANPACSNKLGDIWFLLLTGKMGNYFRKQLWYVGAKKWSSVGVRRNVPQNLYYCIVFKRSLSLAQNCTCDGCVDGHKSNFVRLIFSVLQMCLLLVLYSRFYLCFSTGNLECQAEDVFWRQDTSIFPPYIIWSNFSFSNNNSIFIILYNLHISLFSMFSTRVCSSVCHENVWLILIGSNLKQLQLWTDQKVLQTLAASPRTA